MTEGFQFIFNQPERAKSRKGRPESLDDSILEIGWKLQKCKKASDSVSPILTPRSFEDGDESRSRMY